VTVLDTTFDLDYYLERFDVDALERSPDYRRAVTQADPLAFALVYMPHHLRGDDTGGITFSAFHLDLFRQAQQWMKPVARPAEARDCYVAPRGAGKSTLCFLLLPMWAAAHGWVKFIAAFADSASQAELHLQTFKRELETNELLQLDYPDLCAPAVRPRGATVSDSRGMLVTRGGFVFGARGIDAASLGMKVGASRPDMLLLDDIEPDEANYSAYQKGKRLSSVRDAVFPLSVYARVVIVGTVTMPGSIVHDMVKTVLPGEGPPAWVAEEGIRVHLYPALITDDATGEERSLWPEKWPLAYLQSICMTRSFLKNYMNNPMGADGDYWTSDDFRHGLPDAPLTGQLLSIDPAVTSKGSSDFTGLAVIAYSKPAGQALVRHVRAVKVPPGEELRSLVLRIIDAYPETTGILIESNQGGQVWRAILHHMPIPVKTIHQHEPKEVRAARLLNHYQMGRVLHERSLPVAEEQMISFPKGANDDVVDAIGAGVQVFLGKRKQGGTSSTPYV